MTRFSGIVGGAGIPIELQRSTPRDVVLSSAGRTLVVLAVFLIMAGIAGGMWLYVLAGEAQVQAERRSREGVGTQADIVSIRRTRGEKPKAILTYRFLVDGQEYSGRGSMPSRAARHLDVGSAVPIGYVASQPEENWLAGREPTGPPLPVVPLLPLATTAGSAMIFWAIRGQRRTLEEARPALARVVSSQRVMSGHHSSQRITVDYEDLSGVHHTSRLNMTGKPPEPGSTITILYDRDDPRVIARYPLSLVRVVAPL